MTRTRPPDAIRIDVLATAAGGGLLIILGFWLALASCGVVHG